MGVWRRVADESAVVEGRGLAVTCRGHPLVLFRLPDGIYALDGVCSHEYALLAEGEIWDEDVYCPRHGSRFSIRTGAVQGLPATRPVRSYPVKVEEGGVYVEWEA